MSWPEAYAFDDGAPGWGAHPDSGDWQEGQQITIVDTPAWNGHASLQFSPTPAASTVSMRRTGHVTRVRARVLLVPSDGSSTPIRLGFVRFDADWQWHDDSFRWVVPPNSWTTISWNLPDPGDYPEIGIKLPAGISRAYIGSFEIEP